MAINDSFNLNNALTSQSYAYKCWYNYNYCGNTMGIDSKSMSEINQNWSGELANWRATASNDENAYEIEDDDYSSAKNRGKEIGKDKTGYKGGKAGMIANTTVYAVGGTATIATATVKGAKNLFNNSSSKLAGKTYGNKGKFSDIATVVMAAAVAAKYWIQKPNKEQKEAA